jgi:Fe2+ or Zn2+ uptake regulation protein
VTTDAEPALTQDLVALLRSGGRRVTSPRLAILRELRQAGGHVSAHHVYQRVRPELPGISVPTVYATLELLVELGLARRVEAGARATLYDSRTDPHGHAVCRRCGAVADIPASVEEEPLLRAAQGDGFRAESAELLVRGLCCACR